MTPSRAAPTPRTVSSRPGGGAFAPFVATAPDWAAPIETAERIEAAAKLLAAGQAGEAERFLREILAREPNNPDAVNTFASVALTQGDGARAFDILGPACTAHPDHPRLLANLGLAHFMLGRVAEAVACLERALAQAPEDCGMRLSLARYCAADGDLDRALAEIETVLRHDPAHAEALAQLGATAWAAGDRAKGEAAMRRAAALDPDNADLLGNLSIFCGLDGRFDEAALLAERAYLRAPLDLARQVQHARCQATIGHLEAAAALSRRILAVAPDHVAASEILARVSVACGAIDTGLALVTALVRRRPKAAEAILALAGVLRFAGRLGQALAFVEQAVAVAPDHVHGRALRRDIVLTLGRFAEVWPTPATPGQGQGQGERDGSEGQPRAIRVERGTGMIEAILFARFLPEPPPDGLGLVSWAEPPVEDLLRHVAGVRLRPAESGTEAIDLLALPGLLGVDRAAIRGRGVSFVPRPALLQRWRAGFSGMPRPLIGLAWDPYRPGLRLADVVAGLPETATLVGLAQGAERHQLAELPRALDAGVHIRSSAELLAAMACLDAFVGPESVPLHLAGALGLPGVAIAAAGASWSMAADGDRLLWHPSLRRLAQAVPGRWDDVTVALPEALASSLAASSGVEARRR